MRPLFVLVYRSPRSEVSGLWGPFTTRGDADFFARNHLHGGTYTIERVKPPTDFLEN